MNRDHFGNWKKVPTVKGLTIKPFQVLNLRRGIENESMNIGPVVDSQTNGKL